MTTRPHGRRTSVFALTPREQALYALDTAGSTPAQIAQHLGLSPVTVRQALTAMREKLRLQRALDQEAGR